MILRIAKHEARLLWRDRSLMLVVVLFGLMCVYAIGRGSAWVHERRAELAPLPDSGRQSLHNLRERLANDDEGVPNPSAAHVAGGVSQTLIAPPGPLAEFSIGRADVAPDRTEVSLMRSAHALDDAPTDLANPTHLLLGVFDLAFVLIYLYPLVILAVSFDLLAGERDQGTLALVRSQPVALWKFLAAKIVCRFALLIGLLVFIFVVSLIKTGDGSRSLMWLILSITYGAFWFSLALAVNASDRSAAWNAVFLIGVWVLLVLVAPGVIPTLAAAIDPTPSRVELVTAERSAKPDLQKDGAERLDQFYRDHPELLPAEAKRVQVVRAARILVLQREQHAKLQPLADRFDEQLRRQQAFIARWRYLSPALLMREVFADVAGTGSERMREVRRQFRVFREEWESFFAPHVFRQHPMAVADYDAMPSFEFDEEGDDIVAKRVGWALLGIWVPTLVLAAMAMLRLRRVG